MPLPPLPARVSARCASQVEDEQVHAKFKYGVLKPRLPKPAVASLGVVGATLFFILTLLLQIPRDKGGTTASAPSRSVAGSFPPVASYRPFGRRIRIESLRRIMRYRSARAGYASRILRA